MAGDEVGMQMGEEDVADCEAVFVRKSEVQVDVALRIHDSGCAGLLIADQIRCVREAARVEVLEDYVGQIMPWIRGKTTFMCIDATGFAISRPKQ